MSMSTGVIYTTGAFLSPECLINAEGKPFWVWVVDEFDGDSFKNGDSIDAQEIADTEEGLIKSYDDEEDEDEQDESTEAL